MAAYFSSTWFVLLIVIICTIGSGMSYTPWWLRIATTSVIIGSFTGFYFGIPVGPIVGCIVGSVMGVLGGADKFIAFGVLPGTIMGVLAGNLNDRTYSFPDEPSFVFIFMLLVAGIEVGTCVLNARRIKPGHRW